MTARIATSSGGVGWAGVGRADDFSHLSRADAIKSISYKNGEYAEYSAEVKRIAPHCQHPGSLLKTAVSSLHTKELNMLGRNTVEASTPLAVSIVFNYGDKLHS